MRRVYLLAYSDTLGTREQVKAVLGSISGIIHWRYDMPNTFYLVAELTADQIMRSIAAQLSGGRFLVTEIHENRQGMLPKDTWFLIQNKTHPPRT